MPAGEVRFLKLMSLIDEQVIDAQGHQNGLFSSFFSSIFAKHFFLSFPKGCFGLNCRPLSMLLLISPPRSFIVFKSLSRFIHFGLQYFFLYGQGLRNHAELVHESE